DASRGRQVAQLEAKSPIELHDPVGSLVRQDDRAGMSRQPFGSPYLIAPAETILRVLCELDVVRRIGVHKVVLVEYDALKVEARKLPAGERGHVLRELGPIGDGLV